MDIRKKQEDEKLSHLKHFLQKIELQPGHIERGEDPPDFYMMDGANRIAVELTEYHSVRGGLRGNAWQVVEDEWRKIRDLFIEKRGQYPQFNDVDGFLHFRELEMPPAKHYDRFVTELLEFGISQYGILTEERSLFRSFPSEFPLMNKYLEGMRLQKAGFFTTMWDCNSAVFVGINAEDLKECVSKKLTRPRPQQINKNWLLIISGTSISQHIGLTPCGTFNHFAELNNCLEGSSFDRIYFFQYIRRRVLCWSPGKQWEEISPAWHFSQGT